VAAHHVRADDRGAARDKPAFDVTASAQHAQHGRLVIDEQQPKVVIDETSPLRHDIS
jgi:hypothetical protein